MTIGFTKLGITALSACFGAAIINFDNWIYPFGRNDEKKAIEEIASENKNASCSTRIDQVQALRSGKEYDILIIGGGATGVGCALDAATRGLKTALVEGDDFASGTSSRSTKLIHGGVRYLQKAILQLDSVQYNMVKESLQERKNLLENAPHLVNPLPIMIPIYQWYKLPFYWFGIKCYDMLAGRKNLKSSYFMSAKDTLEVFPLLKSEGLRGALVYYDGQQDDARLCLAIALTARKEGATICNHIEVLKLKKKIDENKNPVICGARVKDHISGKEFDIKAKCVINATGPFTDRIRKMDDPDSKSICAPSSGVHIVLPGYFSPEGMGLLDPATSDGRVIFFLPWQGHALAGTTDLPCEVTQSPRPTEDEIEFILCEVKNYFSDKIDVHRSDILSAWSGVRPLVSDPNKTDTQSIARNHIVHVSPSHLVTIAGGKWTTYRAMAEHAIDAAIKSCDLCPQTYTSVTKNMKIEGAVNWTPTTYIHLVQQYGLEPEVARHLAKAYGTNCTCVAHMAAPSEKDWPIAGRRLHSAFPYIEAEIRYAVRCEFASTAIDMIARRMRLAFLNVSVAEETLNRITDIMAEELHWTTAEKERQIKDAKEFLATQMGGDHLSADSETDTVNVGLSKDELQAFIKLFRLADKDNNGRISLEDIQKAFKHYEQVDIPVEELSKVLDAMETTNNEGLVDLKGYLKLIFAIKVGDVTAYSNLAQIAELEQQKHKAHFNRLRKQINVDRSCGGL